MNATLGVRLEQRWCRIHPAVQHQQLAVCRFDGYPLVWDTCGHCGYCELEEPSWRCVEAQASA